MSGPWRGRLLVVAVILLAGFPAWINVAKKLETLPERVERMKGAANVVQQKGQSVARVKLLPPATGIAPAITGEDATTRIQRNLDEATPAIQACLQKWQDEEPTFSGTTTIEVTVGPAGVTQLALLGHHVVPAPAGHCLTGLLWGLSWPVADPAMVVTRPFARVMLGETVAPTTPSAPAQTVTPTTDPMPGQAVVPTTTPSPAP
jgi:hypothetical protein